MNAVIGKDCIHKSTIDNKVNAVISEIAFT